MSNGPRFDEPWLVARSRQMHAELRAAPNDEATRKAIRDRHVAEVVAERPDAAPGIMGRVVLLAGLLDAGPAADDPSYLRRKLESFYFGRRALAPEAP